MSESVGGSFPHEIRAEALVANRSICVGADGLRLIFGEDHQCYTVRTMNTLLLVILILLLLGGGGFYIGGPVVGGSTLGLILLIVLIVYLVGGFKGRA